MCGDSGACAGCCCGAGVASAEETSDGVASGADTDSWNVSPSPAAVSPRPACAPAASQSALRSASARRGTHKQARKCGFVVVQRGAAEGQLRAGDGARSASSRDAAAAARAAAPPCDATGRPRGPTLQDNAAHARRRAPSAPQASAAPAARWPAAACSPPPSRWPAGAGALPPPRPHCAQAPAAAPPPPSRAARRAAQASRNALAPKEGGAHLGAPRHATGGATSLRRDFPRAPYAYRVRISRAHTQLRKPERPLRGRRDERRGRRRRSGGGVAPLFSG